MAKVSGLRIVLFASLAVNLLVVGAVAGFLIVGPPHPPDRPGGGDPALPYTRALDEDQRRDLRRQLRGDGFRDRQSLRAVREGVLADYRRALDVLRADPYEPAALEALLTEQAARGAEMRDRGHAALSAYIAGMTVAERQAYAARLEETLKRFQQKRGRDGRDGHREGRPRADN